MLEQNLEDMLKAPEEDAEFVVPDEFTKSVVPLKDIEAWTGPSSTQRCMPSINIIPRGPDAAEREREAPARQEALTRRR